MDVRLRDEFAKLTGKFKFIEMRSTVGRTQYIGLNGLKITVEEHICVTLSGERVLITDSIEELSDYLHSFFGILSEVAS